MIMKREKWVAWGAVVCAVHCMAAPFLATLIPFFVTFENLEMYMYAVTLGGFVLVTRGPMSKTPMNLFEITGLWMWLYALLGILPPEAVFTPMGSILFAWGLIIRSRKCRNIGCECNHTLKGK